MSFKDEQLDRSTYMGDAHVDSASTLRSARQRASERDVREAKHDPEDLISTMPLQRSSRGMRVRGRRRGH